MKKYTVITTYTDGELRYYEVFSNNEKEALKKAAISDKNDYPSRQSSFENCVVQKGHNLSKFHVIWGDSDTMTL